MAAVTVACTAPNHTILFAAVVLKFVPVIVTVVPDRTGGWGKGGNNGGMDLSLYS